jgi:phosphoribosylamine--glycine ligase
MPIRVLILGGGAREHALAQRLAAEQAQGGGVDLLCTPGNPGIAELARIASAPLDDPKALVDLAARERVDFTIAGPELPLSLGVADRFAEAGRLFFGPTCAAAALETSKAFAKAFMARHGVPTARFHTAGSLDEALSVIGSGEFGFPVVLKADGLAAGKGVVVAEDRAAADAAVRAVMSEKKFGAAGDRLVIEECLSGPEVSMFFVCDGGRALSIGAAQDHKRIFEDDRGPNTGGMGAFSPSPLVDEALAARVDAEIVRPVVNGMAEEGYPFRGFLYAGLMLTASGPKVIEFNVRLGDPEAQVVLPRIDEPLLPILMSAASGRLRQEMCRLGAARFVGVVLASRGYPESSESGRAIAGVDNAGHLSGVSVCHAGTALRNGTLVTAGGRVLTVVGRGSDFAEAIARAYAGVGQISFDGMQFRRDIGRKALTTVDTKVDGGRG